MPVSRYLPSAQFVVIVASIALSGGLVLAAQYVTRDHSGSYLATSNTTVTQTSDWKAALYEVQGTSPLDMQGGNAVQASLDSLLSDAVTTNVTNTIGRSLFVNLSEAKAQGLGSDVPTQERLIAEATRNLTPSPAKTYTSAELTVVADSPTSLKEYGNTVIEVIAGHPKANVQDTYVTVGTAVDTGDAAKLSALTPIQNEYEAIAEELLAVPVPQTLSPLHLRIVNNFSKIAASMTDMQTIVEDPLRGFGGMQTYNSLTGEVSRMFTNIAQSFSKNAILFENDEPGSAWNAFLPR